VPRLLEKLLAAASRLTLRRRSSFFAVIAGGGLAAVLTLAILGGDRLPVTVWTAGLDRWAFDVRQRALERDLPDNLLIVGTGGSAGADGDSEWDLPWGMLQEFIRRARDAGASVIVLDMMVPEISVDPAADSAFARLLAAHEDIVLAADVRWLQPSGNGAAALSMQDVLLPPPLFTESAAAVGVRSATLDPDSVVRRAQSQSNVLGLPYWSLAVEALRVHLGVPFDQVRLVDGVLELGEHRIEVGRESYIDHRRVRPPFSLQNLLRGSELPARARPLFENAIVLVGPNGPGAETVPTPMHAAIPRLFVDASDLATLLNGRIRRDVPTGLEILLVWVLSIAGAAVFLRRSPGTGLVVWGIGWGALLLLFWLPFAAGMVFGVAGPAFAWALIFPMTMGYRLHISGVDVLARDRSIQALGRLRDIRFDEPRLAETLTPLLETLGGALDAASVLLLQEGGEFWEVVGGIGAPPQDWSELRRVVAKNNGEFVIGPGGKEAFLPIVVDQDERRRVLYVHGSRSLGPLDTHTLLSVASGLHLGFHNRALTRSLEEAYLGILTGISIAVEARDQGTEAHCQRLATYSCTLATELGHEDDFLEALWMGASLHDIGKVGVPDSVFLKPRKLMRKELEVMKQHPVLGYRILEDAPISETAKMCVLHHHERWDGAGYPDGLKEEQIPLGARIVAVVDIFDALTAERAYRKAKTEEWALEHVQSESGGALEPRLVECFSSLHRDGVIRGAAHPIPESARRRWRPQRLRAATLEQSRPMVTAEAESSGEPANVHSNVHTSGTDWPS
jgi:HD-GYP domain-containing protein (c-di-GMP phosphodiesterase class II)/CHASE2 domain-containing sensor protein